MFQKVTILLFAVFIFSVVSQPGRQQSPVPLTSVNSITVAVGNQKAHFIAEVLTKNPHLEEQIWNIGFTALMTGFGNTVNTDTKEKVFNYILDNIPSVMKNKHFQNFVHDVTNEIVIAYNKSDVFRTATDHTDLSSHSTASGVFRKGKTADDKDLSTHSTARDIIKHVDFYKVLSSIIENGKSLFGTARGKNSTFLISILNSIIDSAPIIWHDSSFQHTKDIIIKELALGYQGFLKEYNFSSNAMNGNSTNLIINVIKHTNIGRMIADSLMAEQPILDKIIGKDSTSLLLGIGILANMYPTVISDKKVNTIKEQVVKHVGKTFLKLNYTTVDLQQNASKVITEVILNTNTLKLLKDIMQTSSARHVFPFPSDSKISNKCYSNTMDFLDSLLKMSPWAIKMFDSYGKLSEGILSGHLNMVGSYDQCLDVKANITSGTMMGNRTTEVSKSFEARYCRLSVKIPEGLLALNTKGIIIPLSWGICIPDSCHSRDIVNMFLLKSVKGAAPFLQTASVYCSEKESISDDPSAVAAIVILSLFGCLTLLGTVLKLVLSERGNQQKSCRHEGTKNLQELEVNKQLHSTVLYNAYEDTYSEPRGCTIIPNQLLDGNMSNSYHDGQESCIKVDQSVQKNQTDIKADETQNNNGNYDNFFNAIHWVERFTSQAALSATLAVDTFYMISGMLVIYLQLNYVKKLIKKFECAKMMRYVCFYIFHRFWRLTPLYMMILMIFGCLIKYFGDGPFWPSSIPSADACKSNWWTNLLYISNFLPHDEQCMLWSWFMSNDMQFYLITLIFLVILAKSIPIGVVSVIMLLIGGASSTAYAEHVYKGDLITSRGTKYAYWDHVYIPPWCRVSAYCVGMLLGVTLVNRPRKKLNLVAATIGWVLATIIALFLVYIPYTDHQINGKWALDIRTVYEALGRPMWAACVAWVIFASYNGNGGIANSLLSWRGLVPFSRLSYGAYLIHPIVMMTYVLSRRSLFYLSDYNMIYLYIGHSVLTFMTAFVASLVFESPFMAMEKIIMRR